MSEVPRRARTAAVLFLVYGALVLVTALAGRMDGAGATTDLFRTAVRVIGTILISVGLLRGARWAWQLGVVFGGFWLIMGGIGAAAVIRSRPGYGVSLGALIYVLGVVTCLAGGWALLLSREVRQAYRAR